VQPSLLDTDVLSQWLKLRNPPVVAKASQYLQSHQQFAISAITRYEIVRGLIHRNAQVQLVRFAIFCQHSIVLPISDSILETAADPWVVGRRGGHSHRDADLVIAATALEGSRVLVTGNTAQFAWVPGLTIDDGTKPKRCRRQASWCRPLRARRFQWIVVQAARHEHEGRPHHQAGNRAHDREFQRRGMSTQRARPIERRKTRGGKQPHAPAAHRADHRPEGDAHATTRTAVATTSYRRWQVCGQWRGGRP